MIEQEYQSNIIFILGIMPRSGTHFLANLLNEHPECTKSAIPEDGLLARSNILMHYVNRGVWQWEFEGDVPNISVKELLLESLGSGLKAFLWKAAKEANYVQVKSGSNKTSTRYLIAKTPQVSRIEHFFQFFPNEKLIILIRDGRALVESISTSFGYPREEAIRDWANASEKIKLFESYCKENKRNYLLVKYEDLHSNTEAEIRRILSFLGLNAENYDFKAALNIPVVGSSKFKRGHGEVHWSPVTKTSEFDPLSRTAGWTRRQHERFNWIAKNGLLYFNYKPQKYDSNRLLWVFLNRLLDLKEQVKSRIVKIIRHIIGTIIKQKNYLRRK